MEVTCFGSATGYEYIPNIGYLCKPKPVKGIAKFKSTKMSFISSLDWRHATKRYTGAKISAEKLNTILEAIRKAPSSIGAQPYTIFVVEDAEAKAKIQPLAYGQPQAVEASALIFFAAWTKLTPEQSEKNLKEIEDARGLTRDQLGPLPGYYQNYQSFDEEKFFNWSSRQAYIALGFGLAAAAELQVSSTPMEGFDPNAIDEFLGIKGKGLKTVVLLAVGEGDNEKDYLAGAKKVRRSAEELFVRI